MKKHHYVYCLLRSSVFENDDFDEPFIYVGVRSCSVKPNLDKYFGSGTLLKYIDKSKFKKYIISEFDCRHDADLYEADIVDSEFIEHPGVLNLVPGGKISKNQMYEHTRDKISKISKALWNSEIYREKQKKLSYLRTPSVTQKISSSLKCRSGLI